jgi:hypothetical protein
VGTQVKHLAAEPVFTALDVLIKGVPNGKADAMTPCRTVCSAHRLTFSNLEATLRK